MLCNNLRSYLIYHGFEVLLIRMYKTKKNADLVRHFGRKAKIRSFIISEIEKEELDGYIIVEVIYSNVTFQLDRIFSACNIRIDGHN